ncbi:MAG: glycosyltransferase family 2 protein [Candidatus Bathyarchaeota archaeon]|nr:glycosyltransferase family 2 protein [Candidatus Bathyarchaeota archaeon]
MIGFVDLVLICVFAVVYLWIFYNLPILATGVRNTWKCRKNQKQAVLDSSSFPSFSIVVPVKNEAKLVGRLFDAIKKLDYPKDKIEVLLAEDGSTDSTLDVCNEFARSYGNVTVLQRLVSSGKPSALNHGLKHAKGDIVAVFDADNVPATDALLNAAHYFKDPNVAAVQGRTLSINSQENMLTQFISYEEAIWCEAYLRGKDALGLFVHLKGSCQFLRRETLNNLSGFDENILSEDMEISARLTENGYSIRYGGDVCSWQESPSGLKTLFKQRTRWFRGTMEVAFKYGRLMKAPNLKRLDAEVTLFGPFILIASLFSYLGGSGFFFATFPFNVIWQSFMYFSLAATTFTMLLAGAAMIYVSRPKGIKNLLWLPFIFAYWCLQGFIALYAGLLMLLRRPNKWVKTEKSGTVDDLAFSLSIEQEPQLYA